MCTPIFSFEIGKYPFGIQYINPLYYALFKYFRDVEEFTRSMEFKAEFEELINEALFDEYDKKFITYPQRPLAE